MFPILFVVNSFFYYRDKNLNFPRIFRVNYEFLNFVVSILVCIQNPERKEKFTTYSFFHSKHQCHLQFLLIDQLINLK